MGEWGGGREGGEPYAAGEGEGGGPPRACWSKYGGKTALNDMTEVDINIDSDADRNKVPPACKGILF